MNPLLLSAVIFAACVLHSLLPPWPWPQWWWYHFRQDQSIHSRLTDRFGPRIAWGLVLAGSAVIATFMFLLNPDRR